MLSTLSSFVFFNKVWKARICLIFLALTTFHLQVEIVSLILEDEKFLSDLFGQLRDAKTSEDRRKELVSMMLDVVNDEICDLLHVNSQSTGVVLERVLPVLPDAAATESGKLLQDPLKPWSSPW